MLTVASIDETCDFYARVLGMEVSRFGAGRTALTFGRQKINLHEVGKEFVPRAAHATAGSGDLCLVSATPLDAVVRHLDVCGITIIESRAAIGQELHHEIGEACFGRSDGVACRRCCRWRHGWRGNAALIQGT